MTVAPPRSPDCQLNWRDRFHLTQGDGAGFNCYGQDFHRGADSWIRPDTIPRLITPQVGPLWRQWITETRDDLPVHGAVTVHMEAPAMEIWTLVADVRNTGRFSPETFDAEWLDGVTEPSLGARFRGHVKRNEIGPVYWTTCRVTACDPAREFGFAVLVGNRAVNTWHYEFTPNGSGTDVTESFKVPMPAFLRATSFLGFLRKRRNIRDMRTTLERIRDVVEA